METIEFQEFLKQFAKQLLEASWDPIFYMDAEGSIVDLNKAAVEMLGIPPDRLIGSRFFEYFLEAKKIDISLFGSEDLLTLPLTMENDAGKISEIICNITTYKDNAGKIINIFAIPKIAPANTQDFSYTRSLVEASLDSLIIINSEGKITDVNEATVEVTGIPRKNLIGSDFFKYFTEPEKAREGYELVFSRGKVTDYPLTIRHISGRLTDVLYNASIYKNESGKVLGVCASARDITQQNQASLYARSLIEASLDPLVTISTMGKIMDVNEATTLITGIAKEELIGSDFFAYFTEPEKARAGYEEVFEKGFVKDYPLVMRHKNGKLTDVLYNATVYKDAKGTVMGVCAAARDITIQKQASQYALSLIEASLDPLVTISPDGTITDVNEATIQVTGVSREMLIGSDFCDYFTEPDEAREGYKQVFKEGFVRDYPLAIRHVSGTITDVFYNATVYRDVHGQVLGIFAAARDITQRKKAEKLLHETSAYARSLIESSLDPLITINADGKITAVNHATEIITGVTREWLIGSDFTNYFTEPKKARDGYRLVLKEGLVRDYPLRIQQASGKIVDVLFNATVFRDAHGMVQGIFAAARDVTDTQKSSTYARLILETSLDPFVTISPQGKITDVNEATVSVTGVSRDKLIGTDFFAYFTEPAKAKAGYEQVFEKGFVKDYPLVIRHIRGKETDVLYNASVYKDSEGKVLGVFAAARDCTLINKTTHQLEAINGELDAFTYSVAHDLKAPLRAIDGFSKILREDYGAQFNDEGKRLLNTIVDNTGRMGKLIEDLLALSHIMKFTIKKEHINNMRLIIETIFNELVAGLENRNITIEFKKIHNCIADVGLLKQVWVNLLSNAIKFTQSIPNAKIEIGSSSDNINTITYYIKDNGIGFNMKYSDKLFGVFQRLHGQEIEGTGIGLANIKRIIARHDGKVWADGKIGEGATFYFTLPKE